MAFRPSGEVCSDFMLCRNAFFFQSFKIIFKCVNRLYLSDRLQKVPKVTIYNAFTVKLSIRFWHNIVLLHKSLIIRFLSWRQLQWRLRKAFLKWWRIKEENTKIQVKTLDWIWKRWKIRIQDLKRFTNLNSLWKLVTQNLKLRLTA